MDCPVFTHTDKATVAQKALEWEDAGYSVDMFLEHNQWTVIGFPIRARQD